MDTIVICTLTSLVVLCSGAATGNYGNNDLAGVPTAVAGFASVFGDKLGSLILAVGLLLFATSTILGWALYGTRCAEFLFGSKIIRPYQVLFCLVVIAGSVANLKLVWTSPTPSTASWRSRTSSASCCSAPWSSS